jgi:hypothetical protein
LISQSRARVSFGIRQRNSGASDWLTVQRKHFSGNGN